MTSPYTTRETTDISAIPVYAVPQQRAYAAPPLEEGDAYNDEFGWGPHVGTPSTTDVPAAQRLRTIPRIDMRPDPVRPPEEWYDRRDADTAQRHSVESVDANGWPINKGVNPGDKRWADDPRRTPPAEPRWTQGIGPSTYSFTRPFDQGYARTFNGNHFSMADHRREYEILGMEPVRSRRNTYRIEPGPWDVGVVDLPPDNGESLPQARVRSVEVPYPRQSYRLS